MSKLVRPHGGGELKPLLLQDAALIAEKQRAASLPKVKMTSRETGDVYLGASPRGSLALYRAGQARAARRPAPARRG